MLITLLLPSLCCVSEREDERVREGRKEREKGEREEKEENQREGEKGREKMIIAAE